MIFYCRKKNNNKLYFYDLPLTTFFQTLLIENLSSISTIPIVIIRDERVF